MLDDGVDTADGRLEVVGDAGEQLVLELIGERKGSDLIAEGLRLLSLKDDETGLLVVPQDFNYIQIYRKIAGNRWI